MTDCQGDRCGGKAADTYLCGNCQAILREQLAELPWWLRRLTEAATGQVKLTDNGGRKGARRDELDGEKPLAACIETLPERPHIDQSRQARHQHALAVALAAGGVNASASLLLGKIADELGEWRRVLCEDRGLPFDLPAHRPVCTCRQCRRYLGPAFIGPLRPWQIRANAPAHVGTGKHPSGYLMSYGEDHAAWLLVNIAAIAASEHAAEIMGDICGVKARDNLPRPGYARDIERVINRPVKRWPLGECAEIVRAEGPRQRGKPYPVAPCGTELRAREGARTVTCPDCETRHDVHWLLMLRMDRAEQEAKTWKGLRQFNSELPSDYAIAPSTLYHWHKQGKLIVRGRRECGKCGRNLDCQQCEPVYWWGDVRALAQEKRQKAMTGAAAYRVKVGAGV